MTRQTRIYGGYICTEDVPGWALNPWQHYTQQQNHATCRTPGETTVSSADMSWAANHLAAWECCFVLIEQWIHIFWHQVWHVTQARVIWFLPWSLSQWEPQKAFPRSVHLPSTRLVSIYVSYIWFYHEIRRLHWIHGNILTKKPAIVGFNRSQAKHLQLPAPSGKTPSPQRSGTSPPSPQQDNKKWQPWLRIDTTCVNRVYLIMVMVVKTESLP